ncbi:hypothetical protein C8F04DRAFT_1198752 [Mycena alexandri]|uniref:Uncharacterized protein n=1 Tax=Mycena alexandri TaxID=1745969 RepID=A0AAD6RZT4_9AGAR|nr:hypothetical protein C8F04DRAFT_1198752 [Mycena alexandri]
MFIQDLVQELRVMDPAIVKDEDALDIWIIYGFMCGNFKELICVHRTQNNPRGNVSLQTQGGSKGVPVRLDPGFGGFRPLTKRGASIISRARCPRNCRDHECMPNILVSAPRRAHRRPLKDLTGNAVKSACYRNTKSTTQICTKNSMHALCLQNVFQLEQVKGVLNLNPAPKFKRLRPGAPRELNPGSLELDENIRQKNVVRQKNNFRVFASGAPQETQDRSKSACYRYTKSTIRVGVEIGMRREMVLRADIHSCIEMKHWLCFEFMCIQCNPHEEEGMNEVPVRERKKKAKIPREQ